MKKLLFIIFSADYTGAEGVMEMEKYVQKGCSDEMPREVCKIY